MALEYRAVDRASWSELERLFGGHGNPNYCWCTRWRLPSSDYRRAGSAGRKAALHALVEAGVPVGVLALEGGRAVGWCSIAPRSTYPALERSRSLPRLDESDVWSVACFFVAPEARGRGAAVGLLRSAVRYAVASGARIIEGYPVEPDRSYRFMGSPATFRDAGFTMAATTAGGRLVARFDADRGPQPG